MKILVRLPNWLGDVVMSIAFINKLKDIHRDSTIDIIIKEELEDIVRFLPQVRHTYLYSRTKHKNILQKYKFAREIRANEKYDLFFTLPNSFSSAFIGFFSGAKERIGYKGDWRDILLTKSYSNTFEVHRVEEYLLLLKLYFGSIGLFKGGIYLDFPDTLAENTYLPNDFIVFNATSEAISRSLPYQLAIKVVNNLIDTFKIPVVFTGNSSSKDYYDYLSKNIKEPSYIINLSGKTKIQGLIDVMKAAKIIISTDSGPAHLANALDKKLIVFFGAGNELNTGPYNKSSTMILRAHLECSPCVSNICKFGSPKCLLALDPREVVRKAEKLLTLGEKTEMILD